MINKSPSYVEFYRHHLDDEYLESIKTVINSLQLSSGPQTVAFERTLAEFLGSPHVIGLSSCTDALKLSLRGLGIGAGSEVITTPLTFAATATAIISTGAIPIFADVDPKTGLLTPESVALKITKRTVAIIVVHLYGSMVDISAFSSLAKDKGLYLIEDAAHCIDGSRNGVQPGVASDAACFSFYATKNITSGEGGGVVTRNTVLAKYIRRARCHGMIRLTDGSFGNRYQHWDIENVGLNAKMTEFQAALLVRQIPLINSMLIRRKLIAERYDSVIDNHPILERPSIPVGVNSSRHLYTVWAPIGRQNELLEHFENMGIGIGVHYRCISKLTFIKKANLLPSGECPIAENIGDRTVSIPIYPSLQEKEVERVISALSSALL